MGGARQIDKTVAKKNTLQILEKTCSHVVNVSKSVQGLVTGGAQKNEMKVGLGRMIELVLFRNIW